MKDKFKLFGFAVLMAVIVFSMAACGSNKDDDEDDGTLKVRNTAEWNAVKSTITNGGNNQSYTITVSGNVGVGGSTVPTFGQVTGITVTLQGSGKLYLTSQGNLIRLIANQTLIIDSANLTLQGLTNGQNSATQDNNRAIINVAVATAKLELKNGTISGNTNAETSIVEAGGVSVQGTFNMSGGKISGNESQFSGAGVWVKDGTFTMTGGEISGNTYDGWGGGAGGVGLSGTAKFRLVTGTIYGENETDANLKNVSTNNATGAALYINTSNGTPTAEKGTFNGDTWTSSGILPDSNNTIKVVNGEVAQ